MTMHRGKVATAAWVLLGLSACFDTSPIAYSPPPAPEAGLPADGGPLPEAGVLIAECRQCMMSTCKIDYDPCFKDTKCSALATCMLDSYCMTLDVADLAHIPQCAATCSGNAGIDGQQDPALFLYLNFILCAQNPKMCASVCDVPGVQP